MSKSSQRLSVLGYPVLLWLLFFIAAPLCLVFLTSFLTRGTYGGIEWSFQFDNYMRAFSGTYFQIFLNSLKLATLTTLICFLFAFPMAWAMATASNQKRITAILLIAIPFLMNLIIRVYSVRLFVGFDGPLIEVLKAFSIPHNPFAFSQNQMLVFYGMVTSYLPFMVFPLYAALEKFDFALVEANYDLGGNHWTALTKVLLPNNKQAIASGLLLVFVPCLGEFVIPDLLGGAKNMLIGNLITEQFLKARDWPFGSALGVLLVLVLTLCAFAIQKWGQSGKSKA